MCMDDKRIARHSSSNIRLPCPQSTSGTPAIPGDPNRTAIILSSDGVFPASVFPANAAGSASQGFIMTIQNPVLKMDIETWGLCVTWPWHVTSSDPGGVITCLLVSLEKQ